VSLRSTAIRIALRGLVPIVLVLAGVTWWALESGGVAVVETTTAAGEVRRTHVWYAQDGDVLWLEAGTPTNGWLLDVRGDPVLTLSRPEGIARYRAVPVENEAAHARIRALIRERYGLRDWWVGFLIVDSSQSIAVRLEPVEH